MNRFAVVLAFLIVCAAQGETPAAAGMTLTVRAGQSIQPALDRAQPGDRVEVYPGVYNEDRGIL